MKTELVLLLVFLVLGSLLVYFWKNIFKNLETSSCPPDPRVATWTSKCKPATCVDSLALPKDQCVRYNRCDPQYGPNYLAFDTIVDNELIKTYTSVQCNNAQLCWDDDFEKCFKVRSI